MRQLLISFTLFYAASLAANAADVYQVKDISITLVGADAAKVRDQAMTEGEKKAFEELQKRLLNGGYIKDKKTIPAAQVSAAVDSIDIVAEKINDKDYRATYNLVFSQVEISRIFGIGIILPTGDPEKYMVMPIVRENGKLKIWKNEWLKNWDTQKHENIIIPLGDLQDVQNLKEEDIEAKKYDNILRLEKRYGANNIVLVRAEYVKNKNVLSVQLEKIKDRERISITYEYPGGPSITTADLFEAAANDIIYRLENKKLTDNSLVLDADNGEKKPAKPSPKPPEPYTPIAPGTNYVGVKESAYQQPKAVPAVNQSHVDITIIAPDLIAWNRIRTKLTATPGVNNLQIKSFVGGKANISINQNNDMPALVSSLAAQGLELSDAQGGWQIKETQ